LGGEEGLKRKREEDDDRDGKGKDLLRGCCCCCSHPHHHRGRLSRWRSWKKKRRRSCRLRGWVEERGSSEIRRLRRRRSRRGWRGGEVEEVVGGRKRCWRRRSWVVVGIGWIGSSRVVGKRLN